MVFDPREHLIQLRNGKSSSDYLEVKWRLVWFREECPQGEISTEVVLLDIDKEVQVETFAWNAEKRRSEKVVKTAKGIAVFRAVVKDGKGGLATGTKSESAANFADYIEKAESGAIGRALAALGYGTQFTGDELDEKDRIVDSPVDRDRSNGNTGSHTNGNGANTELSPNSAATERQIASIRKLCQHLDKPEPADLSSMTVQAAKQVIQQLTEEYKAKATPQANNGVNTPARIKPQQMGAIRNMCKKAGQPEPVNLESMSEAEARQLIAELQKAS